MQNEKTRRDEIIALINDNIVTAIGADGWDAIVEEGEVGTTIVECVRYTGSKNLEYLVKTKHFTEGIHALVQWSDINDYEDGEFDPRPINISAYCPIVLVTSNRDDPQGNLLEIETKIADLILTLPGIVMEPVTTGRFYEREDEAVMLMNIVFRVDDIIN